MVGNFFLTAAATTNLTISKTVIGTMGNRDREFEFTVYFKDFNGSPLPQGTQFKYVGDIIGGSGVSVPPDGILTLDFFGSAKFNLKHGQIIVIENVLLDGYVQIVETLNPRYTTFFVDSKNPEVITDGRDTTLRAMTEDRVFDFTNENVEVPPTGIASGDLRPILMLFGVVSSSALALFGTGMIYRRRSMFVA